MLERVRTRSFWVLLLGLVIASIVVCLLGGPQPTLQGLVAPRHFSSSQYIKAIKEYVSEERKSLPNEKTLGGGEEDPNKENVLDDLERYLRGLGFVEQPRLYPAQAWTNVSLPVVVTAVHAHHPIGAVSSFVAAVARCLPQHFLELHTISLPEDTYTSVEKICNSTTSNCTLRPFDLDTFPSHVSNLKFFAYRPIIIQEVLNRAGAALWLDIQYVVTSSSPLERLLPMAERSGLVSWGINQPTSALTHPGMFDFFHTRREPFYFLRMLDPAHVILYNLASVHKGLMKPWVRCALTPECIAPIGAQALGCRFDKKPLFRYSGCHRYDMSALNVLLGLMADFNQTPFMAADQDKFFKIFEEEEAVTGAEDGTSQLMPGADAISAPSQPNATETLLAIVT